MFSFPRLTPLVKRLLIGLLAFFVLQLILQNWVGGIPVYGLLALDHQHPGIATIWQVLTYVLVWPPVPGSVVNFLIALIFLWWVLAPFEERFGARRTAQLGVFAILAAAIPALVVGLVFPRGEPPLHGLNPILLGAIAAYAYSLRGRGQLSFFGVIPMQPMTLVWIVVGISVLLFLADMNVTSLVADLGAIGGGILFVRWMSRPRRPRTKKKSGGRARPKGPFSVIQGGREDDEKPRWLN